MPLTQVSIYPKNLDLSVKKWHVEYRFRNPETGRNQRFKVYEDINRQQGVEKIQYAKNLCKAVSLALLNGYDPFAAEKLLKEQIQRENEKRIRVETVFDRIKYNILRALNFFLTKSKENGLSPSTIARYSTHINYFKEWLNERKMLLTPAADISADHILAYLSEYSQNKNWGNKTYNNYLGSLQSAFNLLAKKIHGIVPYNPIEGATTKTTLSRKHTAYTDEQLNTILGNVRSKKDTFMEGIILSVYYACIRSKAELREFKISNILFDRNLIRLDAEGTKGRRDDHIPLDPELKEFYIKHGFDKLPKNWYVFSKTGLPGPEKAWPNLYAERFKPFKDELGLDDRFTLYGFKHTRNVHLAQAGTDPYALMELNRHKTLDQLMTYLRDLGCTVKGEATKNSRKI